MRVAAKNVLPGDRIRGIGLIVDYSEPNSDHTWVLSGRVTNPHDSEDGCSTFETKVVVPNEHLVNVVRSDENFRADQVRMIHAAIERFNAESVDDGGFSYDDLVFEVTRIANLARGRDVSQAEVQDYLNELRDKDVEPVAHVVLEDLYQG